MSIAALTEFPPPPPTGIPKLPRDEGEKESVVWTGNEVTTDGGSPSGSATMLKLDILDSGREESDSFLINDNYIKGSVNRRGFS